MALEHYGYVEWQKSCGHFDINTPHGVLLWYDLYVCFWWQSDHNSNHEIIHYRKLRTSLLSVRSQGNESRAQNNKKNAAIHKQNDDANF